MTIEVGQTLPEAKLRTVTADGPVDRTTDEIFKGRKVVLFAVPGAFTPTCSLNHLPGFLDNADAILAKGVDEIVCLSVNDHHVMKAWANHAGALGKITFVADGSAVYTKTLGLDIDLSGGGLGVRSKRYAMIVDDGVVSFLGIEDNPGQAVASSAAAVIEKL